MSGGWGWGGGGGVDVLYNAFSLDNEMKVLKICEQRNEKKISFSLFKLISD